MTSRENILTFSEVSTRGNRRRTSVREKAPLSSSNRPSSTHSAVSGSQRNSRAQAPRPSVRKAYAASVDVPSSRSAYSQRHQAKRQVSTHPIVNHERFESEDVEAPSSSRSHSRIADVKKNYRKRRADRKFDRTIGQDAPAQQESSRAALYEMRMGKVQKKSTRMQNGAISTGAAAKRAFATSGFDWRNSPVLIKAFCSIVLVCFTVCLAYPPAQQYYQATRDYQLIESEQQAVNERNESLRHEVDYLSTDQGMEDRATADYGWSKSGENVVSVYGLDSSDSDQSTVAVTKSVQSGSTVAPSTWYSGVLDTLFGYGN